MNHSACTVRGIYATATCAGPPLGDISERDRYVLMGFGTVRFVQLIRAIAERATDTRARAPR